MAYILNSDSVWADVYQLEVTDPALGGPDGVMNYQAIALVKRSNWLRDAAAAAQSAADTAQGTATSAQSAALTAQGAAAAAQSTANTALANAATAQGDATNALEQVSALHGLIVGLRMSWNSGTSIGISAGAAYVPSLGKVLELPAALTKSGLSLSANTWYHLYLYSNAGTPDVEIVTTAPAAPYWGTARAKTSDTTRRYIGSIRTTTGGAVIQFQHYPDGGVVTYLGTDYSLRNRLAAGTATAATTVALSTIIPPTAETADLFLTNAATVGIVVTGNSTQGLPLAGGAGNTYYGYADPMRGTFVPNHPVDSSQAITYRYLSAVTGTGCYIDVNGYRYLR